MHLENYLTKHQWEYIADLRNSIQSKVYVFFVVGCFTETWLCFDCSYDIISVLCEVFVAAKVLISLQMIKVQEKTLENGGCDCAPNSSFCAPIKHQMPLVVSPRSSQYKMIHPRGDQCRHRKGWCLI